MIDPEVTAPLDFKRVSLTLADAVDHCFIMGEAITEDAVIRMMLFM